MSEEKELTMCWFGFLQPYATSVVHVPEQEISPKEISHGRLFFIWDKFMKSDTLTKFLGIPVPWSPAFIEDYSRDWEKNDDGSFSVVLKKTQEGKCLGAVLLVSRLTDSQLKPLIKDYKIRGYQLKQKKVLIGDYMREIEAFLP